MAHSAISFVCLALLSTLAAVHSAPATHEDCDVLSAPENGAVQRVNSVLGQLLTVFICDEGYTAVGETVISCVDGKWDQTPPLCVSVKHCNLITKVEKESVDPTILKCGKLTAPRYGNFDVQIGPDGLSEIASFSCVLGYYVSGSSALHCENGAWDGREPECKPVDCGEPEAPTNGTVEFEDTHFMDIAQYKCDACHVLNGYESRICKRSGLWSKTTPECVPADDIATCPLPQMPGGGYIPDENSLVQNGVACGQVINLSCFSGWRLIGANKATCNPDGTYTYHGLRPRCKALRWT